MGFYQTNFKEFDSSKGFALNIDLTYELTDITKIGLTTFNRFVPSTRAARETGVGFVSTGVSLSVTNNILDPLTLKTILSYRNNDFNRPVEGIDVDRVDDFYSIGFNADYSVREWLSLRLDYRYRQNDSTQESQEYKENRIKALLSISI